MSVPILDIIDLKAAYGRIEVLRGVNLTVPKGAVVALLGPNGGGKSTLLKVISGQMEQTSGDIHLAGVHVTGAKPDDLARLGLTTIPEGRSVFPNLTVEENLLLMSYAGVSADASCTCTPPRWMSPDVAFFCPLMTLTRVLLPPPLGPSSATTAPLGTVRSTPRRTSIRP